MIRLEPGYWPQPKRLEGVCESKRAFERRAIVTDLGGRFLRGRWRGSHRHLRRGRPSRHHAILSLECLLLHHLYTVAQNVKLGNHSRDRGFYRIHGLGQTSSDFLAKSELAKARRCTSLPLARVLSICPWWMRRELVTMWTLVWPIRSRVRRNSHADALIPRSGEAVPSKRT